MNESLPQERVLVAMKVRGPAEDDSQAAPLAGSFDELFQAHWGRIYRLLVRLVGDPAEAEDLALETFYRLYQKRPADGEGSNLGGWLHRVATNLGLHSIRSFQRRQLYELQAGKGFLEELQRDHPAEIQAADEDRRLARLALARMSQKQAELLILRYSGLAYKEIAAVLRLSPSSIGPLLVRAEREFEKQYRAVDQEDV